MVFHQFMQLSLDFVSLTNHLTGFVPSRVYCLVSEARSVAALVSAVTVAFPSYCLERKETEREISNIKTPTHNTHPHFNRNQETRRFTPRRTDSGFSPPETQ